jgi:N-acetylglucosamine kinase-like BadF-type ATPase
VLLAALSKAAAASSGGPFDAAGCHALCVGMAGADRESERVQVQEILQRLGATVTATIVHDAEIALVAGLAEREGGIADRVGIVVVSGTGAISYGVDPLGNRARSGGWGYLLADEGSAFWLGQQVVRRSLRAIDRRGPATTLTEGLARELELASPEKVIAWVYGQPSPQTRFTQLIPVLNDSVERSDPVALQIVDEAAQHLVASAQAVIDQLDFSGYHQVVTVVCAGGAFRGCPALLDSFRLKLEQSSSPDDRTDLALNLALEVELLTRSPAYGAVELARRSLVE